MSITRATTSSVAALGLSMFMAVQVMASSWANPVPITSDEAYVVDGCRSGDSALATLVSFYDYVGVKRSTDGGASWTRLVKIDQGDVNEPAIACRGTAVDAVWLANNRVRYAASHDGGRTFVARRSLSPKSFYEEVYEPDVARGPGGTVAVAWTNEDTAGYPDEIIDRIRVRVSNDGGDTFGRTRTIASSGVAPSVAVGDGVIYVAYQDPDSFELKLRRSTDGGASWKPAITIALQSLDSPDLVARGADAYLAFVRGVRSAHAVVYRHTGDKGATWDPPIRLGAKDGYGSADVHLNLDTDMLQTVYMRCGDKYCNYLGRVMYRQSADGVTWTDAERVAGGELFGRSAVGGVIYVGRPIVLYTESQPRTYTPMSRSSSP